MQKTSFFNVTVFKKTAARFWPVYAVQFFFWMLAVSNYKNGDFLGINGLYIVSFLVDFVFCALSAFCVFNYLFGTKSAIFFHSLPVRRESLFLTNYTAGLLFVLIPKLFAFLFALLLTPAKGTWDVVQWLLLGICPMVFFYGFACFNMLITGTFFVMPVVYTILNFAAVVLETVTRIIMSNLLYGFDSYDVLLTEFSPICHLIRHGRAAGVSYYLIIAAVGILFSVVAFLLYRKRDIENAREIIAVPGLRGAFKYLFSAGCALILGFMIFEVFNSFREFEPFGLWVCIVIGGAIGFFGVVMLMNKSFKVKKREVLGFVIFTAIISAVFLCFATDAFGIEKIVPDTDKITAIYNDPDIGALSTERGSLTAEEAKELHRRAISEKGDTGNGKAYFSIEYDLNGYSLYRRYSLSDDASRPGSTAELIREMSLREDFSERKYGWLNGAVVYDAEIIYQDNYYYFNKTDWSKELSDLADALREDLKKKDRTENEDDDPIWIRVGASFTSKDVTEMFRAIKGDAAYDAAMALIKYKISVTD